MAKTNSEKGAEGGAAPENGVDEVAVAEKRPAEREMTVIPVDIKTEELLRLDETMDLVFVPEALPSLDEETIRELSYNSRRNYFMAAGQRTAREQAKAAKGGPDRSKPPQLWIDDPYAAQVAKQDKMLRARRGWHQTWVRDDELDFFEAINWNGMGYRKVRAKHPDKPDEKPGEETGEVIKLTDRFGNREYVQIQMECPIELYEYGIKAQVYKSKVGYSQDALKTMAEAIEGKVNAKSGRQTEKLSVIAESMEETETLGEG